METKINGRWPIVLAEHRVNFHETHPDWEMAHWQSIHDNIRKGDKVIDIGAEEGDLTALMGTWGAQVIPVEGQPKYWPSIKKHFELNGLTPVGAFAGFAGDFTDLEPPMLDFDWKIGADGWPACAHGEISPDFGFRNSSVQFDATPIMRLEDFYTGIDLMTMDVEGAELQVLKGSAGILKNDKPLVYVSVHPPSLAHDWNQTPQDLFDYMESQGYDKKKHLSTDHEEHWVFWNSKARTLK